jgi:hypothetical protein
VDASRFFSRVVAPVPLPLDVLHLQLDATLLVVAALDVVLGLASDGEGSLCMAAITTIVIILIKHQRYYPLLLQLEVLPLLDPIHKLIPKLKNMKAQPLPQQQFPHRS